MEPILEINGKKYRILRSFHEDRMSIPEYLKDISHVRRDDGMILIVDEIKDVEFIDIIEIQQTIQQTIQG